jgi:hypothetical protein
MNCPGCGAPLAGADPTAPCPACGFPVGMLKMTLMRLYVVTGAMFISVLMYALVVALLRPEGAAQMDGDLVQAAPWVALGVAALLFVIMLRWAEPPPELDPQAASRQVVIQAALAEVPAVLGLVAYLLTGRTQDFVLPLVGSVLLFATLATRVPKVGLAIRRYVYRQWEENRRQ